MCVCVLCVIVGALCCQLAVLGESGGGRGRWVPSVKGRLAAAAALGSSPSCLDVADRSTWERTPGKEREAG